MSNSELRLIKVSAREKSIKSLMPSVNSKMKTLFRLFKSEQSLSKLWIDSSRESRLQRPSVTSKRKLFRRSTQRTRNSILRSRTPNDNLSKWKIKSGRYQPNWPKNSLLKSKRLAKLFRIEYLTNSFL